MTEVSDSRIVSQVNLHTSTTNNTEISRSKPITPVMKTIISLFTVVLCVTALESRQSAPDMVTVSFANDLTGSSVTFDAPADKMIIPSNLSILSTAS